MSEYSSELNVKGDLEITIDYKNGEREVLNYNNTILLSGRRALARALTQFSEENNKLNIVRMLFGNNGTNSDGVKKYVNAGRNGLFGTTILSKPVIANMNQNAVSQAVFTSIVRYEDAVGQTLNEMALQMQSGELYSMITFADLNKTEHMQLTLSWRINFI